MPAGLLGDATPGTRKRLLEAVGAMGARVRARLEQVPLTSTEASSQVRGLAGDLQLDLVDTVRTCANFCIFLRLFAAGHHTRGSTNHWLV